MHLIDAIDRQLAQLDEQSLTRQRRVVETPCAPRVVVGERPMLAFCSNDYLGLAAHPRVVAALHEGADLYGAGSGASHLVSGHLAPHEQIEQEIAGFLGFPRALTFSTGYLANLFLSPAKRKEAEKIPDVQDRLNALKALTEQQQAAISELENLLDGKQA